MSKRNWMLRCGAALLLPALLAGCARPAPPADASSFSAASVSAPQSLPAASDSALSLPEEPAPQTALPPLHVAGTGLALPDGTPIQLKGISTHGLAWFPQYVNEACFRQLREEWGANVIRLAMYTAESGGYCTGGDREQLKQLLRDGVRYAAAQDLYAIVDWHILSDGDPNRYLEESKRFFAELSAEFAAYDHVLYEICNEPNGGVGWASIKAYAQEVIPVIRANDADAVILIGTPTWSQEVDQAAADPITEYDNLMYTLHFYAATHTQALRERLRAALDAGLPVFVSEYGICDASGSGAIDTEQAEAWMSLLDAYGVSCAAWNLSNKQETSALLNAACGKTSGFAPEDLSASGRWVYEMLTGSSAAPAESAPAADSQTASDAASSTGTSPSETVILTDGDLAVTAVLVNQWEENGVPVFQYALTLQNTAESACTSWEAALSFRSAFSLRDGWNGRYTADGCVLRIASMDYNGEIAPGGSISDVGFIVQGGGGLAAETAAG